MSYFPSTSIIGDSCLFVAGAARFHLGVMSSAMHMAFVRQVCGRIKSDYRYSNKLVYNNFPWPENQTDKQRVAVETAAQSVLDARAVHQAKGATLADLCCRPQPFTSERQRVEYLFALYEKLTAPLTAAAKPAARKRRAPSLPLG